MERKYIFQEFCTVSSYKNDIPYADAILYHNRDFNEEDYVKDPSKIHIMFTAESQQYESIRFKPGRLLNTSKLMFFSLFLVIHPLIQ